MIKDLCFEIIQSCPNNCQFCSSCASIDKKNIISLDKVKETIEYLIKKGGIEEISISGREPFLHPELFDIIAYLKSKKITVVLFTSGIKKSSPTSQEAIDVLKKQIIQKYQSYKDITEEEKKKFIQKEFSIIDSAFNNQFGAIAKSDLIKLQAIGLDKIVFDFQAATEEDYKDIMGSNYFTAVSQSMIRASIIGIETDVHFIPMKKNYKQIPDIIELLNIAEVNNLSILKFVPQGRGEINKDKLMLSENELNEFLNILNECKKHFKGALRIGIPLKSEDRHQCTAGLDKMVIKFDGTVLPCPAFKEYNLETLNKIGIPTPNIYNNLHEIEVRNGTRAYPLCKKLYQNKNDNN